jgi:LacI family transcriptional regulator
VQRKPRTTPSARRAAPAAPQNLASLARHLGLSLATVSLVLNGRARALRISPETEARILQAARTFQIQPNRLAASLRSGRTATIGLVVPDVANPFFAALAQQIERTLRNTGVAVFLSDSEESIEVEEASLHELHQRRVDGLILAPVGLQNRRLEALVKKGFPVVSIDRVLPHLALPHVSTDHAGAARQAVVALLEAGHRRIGCLRGSPAAYSDEERVRGYRAALRDAGVEPADDWIAGSGFTRPAAREAAAQLLARPELTAIVSLAGQVTLGLLEAIRDHGRRCPEQLSIVAFDEQPWCSLISPPLTTIEQPIAAIAAQAVALLQHRLNGGAVGAAIHLPSRLIHRSSVGPPFSS